MHKISKCKSIGELDLNSHDNVIVHKYFIFLFELMKLTKFITYNVQDNLNMPRILRI